MAARFGVLAVLMVAVATTCVAGRELYQAQITVANLPKQLQNLNKRWVCVAVCLRGNRFAVQHRR